MEGLKCLILLILYVVKVESLAIKGTPLTRYDPCGLGVVHFDKLSDRNWLGVLNFGLYRNLTKAEIEIHFEKKARIYGESQNSSVILLEEGLAFLIRPSGPLPARYTFKLALEGLGENDADVPTVRKFAMNNITLCSDKIKLHKLRESLKALLYDNKHQEHVCGRTDTELISVRSEAKVGDWPWHVAITFVNATSKFYRCGGTIISLTAVLTACRCVQIEEVRHPADTLFVVAGTINIKQSDQINQQISGVKEVVVNPNCNAATSESDLAVLKVDSFTYTDYVRPICIWGPFYDKSDLFGRLATVVGFGYDVNDNFDGVLKAISTTVQNDTTCWNYSNVYVRLINEFTICAGNGPNSDINVMKGDAGGGLVIPVMQPDQKVSWFLRGVASMCGTNSGKCDPHHYAFYTDVGPHYSWILHHSGLQLKTYPTQQDYVY